jgi:hypothetical protein
MIGTRLNVQEGRHRLARKICFGNRGQLRQRYREGMEDRLGALGLALNAVACRNSLYLDAAVKRLRRQGFPATDADSDHSHHALPPPCQGVLPLISALSLPEGLQTQTHIPVILVGLRSVRITGRSLQAEAGQLPSTFSGRNRGTRRRPSLAVRSPAGQGARARTAVATAALPRGDSVIV